MVLFLNGVSDSGNTTQWSRWRQKVTLSVIGWPLSASCGVPSMTGIDPQTLGVTDLMPVWHNPPCLTIQIQSVNTLTHTLETMRVIVWWVIAPKMNKNVSSPRPACVLLSAFTISTELLHEFSTMKRKLSTHITRVCLLLMVVNI